VYEAHLSIAITGVDRQVWTAYCFVDTYFDTKDSVETYHQMEGFHKGRPDPLALGRIDAELPIWEPRRYFSAIVELRALFIVGEWISTMDKTEKDIERYVGTFTWR
jgi:hypothetical protein